MFDLIKLIATIAAIILLIIFFPFALVWALNTLFPVLNIPYSLETWFASIVLFGTATHLTNRKD